MGFPKVLFMVFFRSPREEVTEVYHILEIKAQPCVQLRPMTIGFYGGTGREGDGFHGSGIKIPIKLFSSGES